MVRGHLCLRCVAIDFKQIFQVPSVGPRPFPTPVGGVRKYFDPECDFCTFIASFGFTPHEIHKKGYRLFADEERNPSSALDLFPVPDSRGNLRRRELCLPTALIVNCERSRTDFLFPSSYIRKDQGVIMRKSDLSWESQCLPHTEDGVGGLVDRQGVHFDLIRSWIDDCHLERDEPHAGCHRPLRPVTFRMKAIACLTRTVVEVGKDTTYLTLSYVWGEPGDRQFTTDLDGSVWERVPDLAPATIEDAMEVVKRIGQRYL